MSITNDDSGISDAAISIGTENGRPVFNVRIGAARQAGLALSSRLLQLARKVR